MKEWKHSQPIPISCMKCGLSSLSLSIIALRYKVYAKKNYINYVLTTCTFTKYKIIFVIHTLPFSYDVNNRLVGFKVNFNIK